MKRPSFIPKNARRAYQSPEFDVWEWKQKMFDGSFKTFRRVVQMPGVSVLASVGNKVLVIKEQQPGTPWYYSLPGGAVDKPGEPIIKTAARELLEETGYEAGKIKLWKVLVHNGRFYHERYLYVAQDCRLMGKPQPDGGERIRVNLLSFDQLLKTIDHPHFFKGDTYAELLRAKSDPKLKNKLKQALFGKK